MKWVLVSVAILLLTLSASSSDTLAGQMGHEAAQAPAPALCQRGWLDLPEDRSKRQLQAHRPSDVAAEDAERTENQMDQGDQGRANKRQSLGSPLPEKVVKQVVGVASVRTTLHVERPELLDQSMKDVLSLPDERPLPVLSQESGEAYKEETLQKKVAVYDQYLERMQVVKDYAEQVKHMNSVEWRQARASKTKRGREGRLSRGILISAGGATLLNSTYANIKILRNLLGCDLPIEIVYDGPNEMDESTRRLFEASFRNVRCIDSSSILRPGHTAAGTPDQSMGWRHNSPEGYVQKIFALCYVTSFAEVLMLDGDNLPLTDPTHLFTMTEYQQHGNLFFPDFWNAAQGNNPSWQAAPAWALFDLQPPWGNHPESFPMTETGQILMNRLRHSDVLDWLWFLNARSNVLYRCFWGDTGTFRLAFAIAQKSTEFSQLTVQPAAALDRRPAKPSDHHREDYRDTPNLHYKYAFAGMVQHDQKGHPVFAHRTGNTKIEPLQQDFHHFRYLSVPLTAARAYDLVNRGYLLDYQVDATAFQMCWASNLHSFMQHCGLNFSSTDMPIEILPLKAVPSLYKIAVTYEAHFVPGAAV